MPELIIDHKDLKELSVEILSRGSSFRFQARGTSMTPFIRHGDILTVQPVVPAILRVGDVILYHGAGEKLVAHRIIALENGAQDEQFRLVARGDASSGSGEQVYPDQVLGQVVSVERGSRIIQLENPFWRSLGFLWGKLAPIALQLRSGVDWVASGLMARLSSLRVYRHMARKWFGKRARIRIAAPEDASDLSLLYGYNRNPGLEDPSLTFARQIQAVQDDHFVLVAHIEHRLAGSLTVKLSSNEETLYSGRWLFGMLVRLRYRGAGIGLKLLNQTLEEAAEKGASRLNLLVEEDNSAALGLYYKLGFQPFSIPKLDAQLESEVQNGLPRRIILSRSLGNPGE
jgi:RimJ/RimL family protein N-acetyltransferase